ncbi:MAG: hypothetical protein NT154_44420 [Verrucomicrobia bacterium]|nr:hypothetical protein [Verrucomicrobiota bacterium]
MAGDVSTGHNGLKWALKSFPDRPVIYVLGNHEFYGQKVQKLTKELQEMAKGTNVHLLENQACTIGDVLFLGATLWTDFALNGLRRQGNGKRLRIFTPRRCAPLTRHLWPPRDPTKEYRPAQASSQSARSVYGDVLDRERSGRYVRRAVSGPPEPAFQHLLYGIPNTNQAQATSTIRRLGGRPAEQGMNWGGYRF